MEVSKVHDDVIGSRFRDRPSLHAARLLLLDT